MATPKQVGKTRFRSKFEARVAANMDRNGIGWKYEPTTFRILLPATRGHICADCRSKQISRETTYTPDFQLENGIYVEAKGKFDARSRKAILAFAWRYPLSPLRLVFQRDNWMTPRRKQRYSDWAKANGFVFAIGESVPVAWIKEKRE